MEGRTREGLASTDPKNVARVFALLLGLGYVAAGVVGFAFTGFTGVVSNGDATLLGFDLNIFHNVVHLGVGAALVVASRVRDVTITQGVLIGVGLFYVLAALLGFLNYLQIISIDAPLAPDNFLHIVSGATALIFGLIGVRQQSQSLRGKRTSGSTGTRGTTYTEEAY